jgi:hypothetical protein
MGYGSVDPVAGSGKKTEDAIECERDDETRRALLRLDSAVVRLGRFGFGSLHGDQRPCTPCNRGQCRGDPWQGEQRLGGRGGRVEALIVACNPRRKGDRPNHEHMLCYRSGRGTVRRFLQPCDVCRARLELTELVLEQCPHRKRTRIAGLSCRADVAHFARGLPVALVDGQAGVVESGGGKRPAVAEPLREGERRLGVGADLRPLA